MWETISFLFLVAAGVGWGRVVWLNSDVKELSQQLIRWGRRPNCGPWKNVSMERREQAEENTGVKASRRVY